MTRRASVPPSSVLKRGSRRVARSNPTTLLEVQREADVTHLWVTTGPYASMLQISPPFAGARSNIKGVFARVFTPELPGSLTFRGVLRPDGTLRWSKAHWFVSSEPVHLDDALDAAGASLDRLLELYFQELPVGQYTLAEWP